MVFLLMMSTQLKMSFARSATSRLEWFDNDSILEKYTDSSIRVTHSANKSWKAKYWWFRAIPQEEVESFMSGSPLDCFHTGHVMSSASLIRLNTCWLSKVDSLWESTTSTLSQKMSDLRRMFCLWGSRPLRMLYFRGSSSTFKLSSIIAIKSKNTYFMNIECYQIAIKIFYEWRPCQRLSSRSKSYCLAPEEASWSTWYHRTYDCILPHDPQFCWRGIWETSNNFNRWVCSFVQYLNVWSE